MTRLMIKKSNLGSERMHLTVTSPVPAFEERAGFFNSPGIFAE